MSFTSRFQAPGVKKIYGSKKKRPVSTSSNDLQPHKRTSGDVTRLPADPRPATDRSQPDSSAADRFQPPAKSVTSGKNSATHSEQSKGTPAGKDSVAFSALKGAPVAGPSSKKPDDADVTPSPSAKEEEPSQTPSAKSGAQSVLVSATAGAAGSEKSGTPGDKDSAGSGGGGEATPTSTTEDGQPKGTPARKDKGPIASRGVPVSGGSSMKPGDADVIPSPSAKEESSQTPSAKNGAQSAPQASATFGAEDDDGSGGGSAGVPSKSKSVTPGKDSAAGALATPTPGEQQDEPSKGPINGSTPSTSAKESSKVASVRSGGGKDEGKSAPKAGKDGTGKESAKEDIGSSNDDAPTPAMVSAKSTPVGSPVEQSKGGTPASKDSGAPIAPKGVPVSVAGSGQSAEANQVQEDIYFLGEYSHASRIASAAPPSTSSTTVHFVGEKDADALPGTSAPPPITNSLPQGPPMASLVKKVMAKTGLSEVKAACALFFATPPFTVSAAVKLGNSKEGKWFPMEKKPFMGNSVGPKLFNVAAWWNEPADENAADMLAFRLYSNITTEIRRHAFLTEADLRRVFPIIYHCYLDRQTPAHSGKNAKDMIAYHLPAYQDAAPLGSEIKGWSVGWVQKRYYKYLGDSAPKVPSGGACTLATENLQGVTRDYVPNQEMIDQSAMSAAYKPSSMFKNPLLQFRSSLPTDENQGEMEEEVPGIIVRVLHDWAAGRLSRFRLPPPPLNLPPPPANAHPAAVKMVHEKFKDNPQVIALFYSEDYLEACYPIALKFITMLATNSLFLKDFTEVYVIFEQLPKEEQCLFNLVLLLIYVGIALQTEERLSREKAHKVAIGKPNGKMARHNLCLYRAAAQSLAGGINICRMTPFSPKLSNQGGALVELANIRFLRKLSGQELLNKQLGSSSMAGPAVDMLSDEELVTLGAVFFLWAFKRDALYAPVLKYATGHPPQKIPYFRLRLNDQLIADLQAEVAEEDVEGEDEDDED